MSRLIFFFNVITNIWFFFLVDTAYEDAVSTRVQDSQLPRIFTYLRGEKKIV